MTDFDRTANALVELYGMEFGGKPSGRYRIPVKVLRDMLKRRRLYADDIAGLTRALFEQGYVLIDMEGFFVVMSANAFVNYRRVGKEALTLID
ncbi:hypothetical protein WNZ15_12245 [Roseibium sp. AS2]|uniref:hypothetical protein n=1 Tax=Roseibium sp. AS2 TaxID=3135781 RepID=UPI0031794CEE